MDFGDHQVECEILDVSAAGAKIRVGQHVEPEELVTLRSEIGDLVAAVVWQKSDYVGLRFDEDPDHVSGLIETFLAGPAHPRERRRSLRHIVLWSGRIASRDQETDCVVLNVSLGGAKVVVKEYFAALAPVVLRIDRFGDFASTVIWQHGGELGLRFDDDPEVIARRISPELPEISDDVQTP
jgi:hypothetical protein